MNMICCRRAYVIHGACLAVRTPVRQALSSRMYQTNIITVGSLEHAIALIKQYSTSFNVDSLVQFQNNKALLERCCVQRLQDDPLGVNGSRWNDSMKIV
jgi:hypothetical protein